MRTRVTIATLAALAMMSSAADAQRTTRTSSQSARGQQPIELGVDGQVAFGMDNQGTAVQLPVSKVRAGFHLSPAISLEPSLGFIRAGNGNNSASNLAADFSMLYHFSPIRSANQFYLRPVLGLTRWSESIDNGTTTVSESATYTNIGLGGGMKMPIFNRMAARGELEFRNQLKRDTEPAQSWLNMNVGLSVYTR